MSIVKGYSKKNNTTYFYEQDMKWSSELGRPVGTRKLIGKLDNETGLMVPTGKRGRPKKEVQGTDSSAATDDGAAINNLKKQLSDAVERNRELSDEITSLKREIKEYERRFKSLEKMIQSWNETV